MVVAAFSMIAFSCNELTELDLLDNPNEVSPDQAGVDFVYNNIQLTFNNFYNNFRGISEGLVRYRTLGAFTYNNALPESSGDGAWFNAYSNLFPDIEVLESLSAERGLDIHSGSAKIMKAYVLTTLVDYFGDVPNSRAGQGTDVISPAPDPGADVYAAAEALLDEAIAQLSGTSAGAPASDIFYNGNADNWVAAANTLKLRIYNNTRLVDASAGAKMSSLINSGANIIDSPDEDFQFQYGKNRNNPNSRHPFYNGDYETADGGYMSNYFMWAMCCEKEVVDPRIRFYFFRQVDNSLPDNDNVFSCHLTDRPEGFMPDHFAAVDANLPYCVAADNGYYGRDHGNGSGIPPDGPIRAEFGVYPGGGRWDGDHFEFTQNAGTDGGLGEGISPIMLTSFVDFMRAEAALTAGTGEDARALLESGVRASIDKVLSFASLDGGNVNGTRVVRGVTVSLSDLFLPDSDDIDAYVNVVLAAYDAATTDRDRLDVVVKEAFIAYHGNATEMFNMYRRTGSPLNIQPGVDAQAMPPGNEGFPRSILYPAVHVNLNAEVSQKDGLLNRVFWDDGSATLR